MFAPSTASSAASSRNWCASRASTQASGLNQNAAVAPRAEVGAPFGLPFRRGEMVLRVGWAVLRPQAQ